MQIYFKPRSAVRAFASKSGKPVDNGQQAQAGKRWGFAIQRKQG